MRSTLLLLLLSTILALALQSFPRIQQDVLYWLNQVRTNPKSIIPHLQSQIARFNGSVMPITPYFNYATKQGPAAWIQAVKYLSKQRPIGTLKRHQGLDQAAYDHAIDLKEKDTISHEGTDGSRPKHRVQKHCVFESGQISQNIAQQFLIEGRNHGLEAIVSLIVDDGVADRSHRYSLFTAQYNYAGVNVQKTSDHYVVVIELSSHNLKLKNMHPSINQSKSLQTHSSKFPKELKDRSHKQDTNSTSPRKASTRSFGSSKDQPFVWRHKA